MQDDSASMCAGNVGKDKVLERSNSALSHKFMYFQYALE